MSTPARMRRGWMTPEPRRLLLTKGKAILRASGTCARRRRALRSRLTRHGALHPLLFVPAGRERPVQRAGERARRTPPRTTATDAPDTSPRGQIRSLVGRRRLWRVALLFVAAFGFLGDPSPGFAQPPEIPAELLEIQNPGFEEPALEDGGFVTSIPGWNRHDPNGVNPLTGVWNPIIGLDYDAKCEQKNAAFVEIGQGGPAAGIRQQLTAVLEENTRYEFAVCVGNTSGQFEPEFLGFPGYRVELLAGNRLLVADIGSVQPAEGLFERFSLFYTTSTADPNVGEPLEVRLLNRRAGPGLTLDFDDVRIEATPRPVQTYLFSFSDPEGSVSGSFSYDRQANFLLQSFPGTATIFVSEASGDLAELADFDFSSGLVEVGDGEIVVGKSGTFFQFPFRISSLGFDQPLPLESFRDDRARVFVNGEMVVDGLNPLTVIELPEPDARASALAVGLALLVLAARRSRRVS